MFAVVAIVVGWLLGSPTPEGALAALVSATAYLCVRVEKERKRYAAVFGFGRHRGA